MFKFLKEKKKDNKGFTLVELVVVVAILAILVGLLAPQYTKYVERSRKAADASNLDSLVTAVKVATADQTYSDIFPADKDSIDIVITMDATKGTTVKYDTADITAANPSKGAKALADAFIEYAGNEWNKTTLKSKAWSIGDENNKVTAISATCKVYKSGSVEVTYNPENVKNYVKEGK